MSGIREIPSVDFIKSLVSIFYPNPDLSHIIEFHISRMNQDKIMEEFAELYPEIELYYYPSKLNTMVYDGHIPFDSCISILRQLLRKRGYKVITKTIKKRLSKEKVMIIHPPLQ
jgi:repressor of nif and glnA expression